jgi:hypothetical protein
MTGMICPFLKKKRVEIWIKLWLKSVVNGKKRIILRIGFFNPRAKKIRAVARAPKL